MNPHNIMKFSSTLNVLYLEQKKSIANKTIQKIEKFVKQIILTYSFEDAIIEFDKHCIDVVIVDLNFYKSNIINIVKKLKSLDENLSIILVSDRDKSHNIIDSLNLDIDGYLFNPIDINQFIIILEKLLIKTENENHINLLKQYQEVTDKNLTVSKTNTSGKITYVNDKFCETSGYSKDFLLGKSHNIIRHPDTPVETFKDMWNTIKTKKITWNGMVRNLNKNGETYYVKTTIIPIFNKCGELFEYISVRDNITEILNPKKQLHDLIASYDETIVALLKIDDFDNIENFYGIKLSEKIEFEFFKKMKLSLPEHMFFGKFFSLGNGEYAFAKMKSDTFEENKFIESIKEFKDNLSDTKLTIDDLDYDISIIISVAYGVNSLENAKYGLKKIYNNKQDFIIANNLIEKESEETLKNIETIKMIKQAILDSKIVSYFQPIINNKTKEIEKYESLVRLIDKNGKVISPYFFLDISKKGKYYSQITDIVLNNSFKALMITDKDISINISILDIEKLKTREKIFELLAIYKDQLHRVVFELLEDEDVKDLKLIKSFIYTVKKMGVKIAIDDFGTGYSNFERLLSYQPDILKIDGSLIKNIENDNFSLDIVQTIVNFAKKQNIKIVAEFVESENIYKILHSLGIDYSQGYYFGKPEALK